jgi:hypothetical protein
MRAEADRSRDPAKDQNGGDAGPKKLNKNFFRLLPRICFSISKWFFDQQHFNYGAVGVCKLEYLILSLVARITAIDAARGETIAHLPEKVTRRLQRP